MVASDGVRAMMESALTARDRVGVQDFVLLENYTSEAAFIENLRKRFKENLIYVSGRGGMDMCTAIIKMVTCVPALFIRIYLHFKLRVPVIFFSFKYLF